MAKGIAILLMIQVHLMELFAQQQILNGLFGKVSLFLGGPAVAPVFMAVMGYFLGKTKRSVLQLFLRGCGLLLVGLLLNTGLNLNLLIKIYRGVLELNYLEYLLGVDILILAGLSIMIVGSLHPLLKETIPLYFLFSFLVVLLTPYINTILTVKSSLRYLCAFLGGNYHWSYFPLFPWLAYPLLGCGFFLLAEKYFNKTSNLDLQLTGVVILGIFIAPTLQYAAKISSTLKIYYHHGPLFFLWTTLFMLFWIMLLCILESDLGETTLFCYIKWLGKHVTAAYILQWLIIGNIATSIFKTQNLSQLSVWYVAIVLLVSLLMFLWLKIKTKVSDHILINGR